MGVYGREEVGENLQRNCFEGYDAVVVGEWVVDKFECNVLSVRFFLLGGKWCGRTGGFYPHRHAAACDDGIRCACI